jgi:hypothetical protein
MAAVLRPVLSVHDQDVEPAIAVRVEERAARSQRLRQPLLSLTSGVVLKVDVRFGGDISESNRYFRRLVL